MEELNALKGQVLIINSELKQDYLSENKREDLRAKRSSIEKMIVLKEREIEMIKRRKRAELIKTGKKMAVGLAIGYAWNKVTSLIS